MLAAYLPRAMPIRESSFKETKEPMTCQPNIVLFMTDQLRRDALACYGNRICQTPNLDQLAEQGTCFENAFTVSPVCSPSRASLLTGLYPHNHGVMINTHIAPAWSPGLSPEIPTFSSILKQSGYSLDYVGKWHVHKELEPFDFGFDRYEKGGGKYEIVPGSEIELDFGNGHRQLVAATNGCSAEETSVWQRTQVGIRALRERAKENQPFFLRIDLPEPHFACLPPEPYASMYAPDDIPPWDNFRDDFSGKPMGHLRKRQEWHLQDKDWTWWSQIVAKYYGVVSFIDSCVGEVRKTIRELGIENETIIVFSTDHGDAMGSHGHFEKAGTMYDEVFRIPMIVKGPREWVTPGRINAFVRSLDLMPTFVEWSGSQISTSIDGRSLAPWGRGDKVKNWPDSVYCEHHGEVWGYHSQRMVRTERWKYVYDPHSMDELYNLEDDPGELFNRVNDSACCEVLQEMKARLLGWNDVTNDMFQWNWVRWNFPEPLLPDGITEMSAH
jgi:arylsulfatase A-like enzyme